MISAPSSESEFGAQFHGAVAISDAAGAGTLVSCTSDTSKGRRRQAHVGIAEVWSVSHAKCFSSELKAHPLSYREVAENCGIEIEEPRAGELIAPHIAEHAIGNDRAVRIRVCACRLTERGSIEPEVGVDTPKHVERRNLNGILRRSRCIEVISVCSEVKRRTAHSGEHASHTPSAQNPTCRARIEEVLVLSKRQLVQVTLDKRMSPTAACFRIVALKV